jgi:protease-4
MATERAPGRARRFLVGFLAIVGGLTLAFFLLLMIAGITAARGERMPGRVILELDLQGGLIEHAPEDVFGSIMSARRLTVRDVVDALKRGEEDDRVTGLIARVTGDLDLAQAEELREAVTSFRASGKPAVVFSETFGEFGPGRGGYYLASSFEQIHLQPSGELGIAGFIAETPFLGGTLELLGVEPQMDQRHEYKNALNTIVDEEMGDAQREATGRVLESFFENLVAGIAEGRGLDARQVRTLIDGGPYNAQEALQAGLVDRLSYRDEAYDSLQARVGGDFLLVDAYLDRAGRPNRSGPAIALIYGTGTIQLGESQVNPIAGGAVMGAESVARAFRAAVEADDVEAILFRIDSPGGSYVASDVIWREAERARAAGKPVIVSMASTAGSGGYFVAMGADRIVAHPSTITGSIGVYGGKMLIDELTGKLGVSWDDVRVGGNPTMWSTVEPYSEAEWAKVQASLDRIYADFTAKAGRGRDLSPDSTHAIARGRIWTGSDALRIGLVDELGGFATALRAAREEAGLAADRNVQVRVYPRPRSFFEMILDPRPEDGYRTALEDAVRGGAAVGRVVEELTAAGILRSEGALLMPMLPVVR